MKQPEMEKPKAWAELHEADKRAKAALKEQLVFRVHSLLGLPAPAPA